MSREAVLRFAGSRPAGGGRKQCRHGLPVWAAEAGACIPAGGGIEVAVVTLGNVSQRLRVLIQHGLEIPNGLARELIDPRQQSRPQGCHRTRAADYRIGSIDTNVVPGLRICITGHVRNAAHGERCGRSVGIRRLQIRLPGRKREKSTDATAARPALRAIVPYDLTRDTGLAALEARAAAGERIRTRGRKVDVISAIRHPVARPTISRGYADRDTESGGRLKRIVHRRHRLVGPGRLGTTPTYREDRRLVGRIVDRRGDRVQKTGIRVGSEIDRNVRLGRDRTDDFDIEHHFPIRPVRVPGGCILAPIDGDCRDGRCGNLELREVGLQVRRCETTAKLDDSHALPLPRGLRVAVERGNLYRSEYNWFGRLVLGRGALHPEMSLRLRTIVEAEHRFHHPIQLLGEQDDTLPAPIGPARMLESLQLHAERDLKLCHGAGKYHGTTSGIFLYDTQAVSRCELLDGRNIRGLRSVLPREVLACQMPDRAVATGEPTYPVPQVRTPAPPHQHTDLHSLRRICGPYRP